MTMPQHGSCLISRRALKLLLLRGFVSPPPRLFHCAAAVAIFENAAIGDTEDDSGDQCYAAWDAAEFRQDRPHALAACLTPITLPADSVAPILAPLHSQSVKN